MKNSEFQNLESKMTGNDKYQFELIKGGFESDEAREVLVNLIQEKINFQKKLKVQKWEKNHTYNLSYIEKRIEELEIEKNKLIEFFNQNQDAENIVNIKSNVEISIERKK